MKRKTRPFFLSALMGHPFKQRLLENLTDFVIKYLALPMTRGLKLNNGFQGGNFVL